MLKYIFLLIGVACFMPTTGIGAQTAVTTSGGTTGTVPVYTGGATIGNSAITQSGSYVGISVPLSVLANDTLVTPNQTVIGGGVYFQPTSSTTYNLSGFASYNFFHMNLGGTGTNSDPYVSVQGNHFEQLAGTGYQASASVITNTFELGGGTTGYGLMIVDNALASFYNSSANIGTLSLFGGQLNFLSSYTGTITNLYGMYLPNIAGGTNSYAIYSAGGQSYFAGNIGIGTATPGAALEVKGNVKLTSGSGASMTFQDGSVQSVAWNGVLSGGDYAESVDVTGDSVSYEPGDVLVIDPDHDGRFLKSAQSYSTAVTGVYSTRPGVIGRRQKSDQSHMKEEVPMAMTGIVPIKVSAENGSIQPGDLLVTSSKLGFAMKGTDRTQMLGAVIGKALGHLDRGTGLVEAVVSLQ